MGEHFAHVSLVICTSLCVICTSDLQLWVWKAAAPPCSPVSPSPCSGRSCVLWCLSPPLERSPVVSLDASSSAGQTGRGERFAVCHYFLYFHPLLPCRAEISLFSSLIFSYVYCLLQTGPSLAASILSYTIPFSRPDNLWNIIHLKLLWLYNKKCLSSG